ncbi:MAG: beta-N-acetylhexosaminidase [Caldicoprobacter sp.]
MKVMKIDHLSLEQKIGQMLMVGFHSTFYDDHIEQLIREYKIGNVILFSRNIEDINQTRELCAQIQSQAIKYTGIPAFISIDQEGGMVVRFHKDVTYLPGNMAVGATYDPANARKVATIAAKELKALGINMNFAPVLDVNNNPLNPIIGVRSYGEDPKKVADFGVSYIKGLQGNGVIATAKHFPGHGDTAVDSHVDLPLVPHDKERLQRVELYTFRKAVESGVDAVMTAHILFPALEDDRLPATLSYNILTKVLREKLGFNGVIVTDCMEMSAIAKYFGTAAAVVQAIKAGADLVLISHTKETQIGAFNKIKKAVLRGEISIDRIDESVNRILRLKQKYRLFENPYPDESGIKLIGSKEHWEIVREISLKSITLVKDEFKLLPVRGKNILAVSPQMMPASAADDRMLPSLSFADSFVSFADSFVDRFGGTRKVIPLNPDEPTIDSIVAEAVGKDAVVVGTYNAHLNPAQAKLVNSLLDASKKVMVVALRNPYDLLSFKGVSTYLCAYEYTPLSVESVLEVLNGKIVPQGKLPVSL